MRFQYISTGQNSYTTINNTKHPQYNRTISQNYHKKKVKILVQTYEKNIYRIDETWMGSAPISALNATEGEFPVPM